jgi:hypothetical protein
VAVAGSFRRGRQPPPLAGHKICPEDLILGQASMRQPFILIIKARAAMEHPLLMQTEMPFIMVAAAQGQPAFLVTRYGAGAAVDRSPRQRLELPTLGVTAAQEVQLARALRVLPLLVVAAQPARAQTLALALPAK